MVRDLLALALDLANIVGGFLLAAGLLRWAPNIAGGVWHTRVALDRFGWIVGVVALVASGYWLLVHMTEGPHLFHYEVVGLAVGIALTWERLTGRARPESRDGEEAGGVVLLLAVLGIIAIFVGVQGLFTPNG
jgi:hypothetical protein